MSQNYTSASTSINSKRLPAVYNRLTSSALSGRTVLDYGCGRYIDHIKSAVESDGSSVYCPLDKYNQPDDVNEDSLNRITLTQRVKGVKGAIICSNVLNVIDDDATVMVLINWFSYMGNHGVDVYVTVYEGDGTGEGRQTGKDSYQRNEKIKNYLARFESGFVLKKGVITNRPENIK